MAAQRGAGRPRRIGSIPGGRDAWLLVGARVAVSAQRALAGVVVPIYLARIGFSGLELGALFAAVAAVAALMSALIGWTADRVGRKSFLIVIPLLMAAAAVVFATTQITAWLFAAAAVGSFGRGGGAGAGTVGPYQPAEQALLSELVPDRDRNRLFGVLASASALGALAGGLSAALAPGGRGHAAVAGYRPPFLVAGALAALAALLAVPVRDSVRARRTSPTHSHAPRRRLSRSSWRLITRLWVTNATNGLAVGMFGPFVTYWFYRRFGAGTAEIGILFAIVNAATIVTSYGTAPIARRLGTVRSVVITRTVQALLLIPLALAPTFTVAGGIYLMRMVSQRIGMALRQSFVMGAAPQDERATVAAFSQLPTQALAAAAPTLSGYLFDSVSMSLPFELAGLLQLVNAVLFGRFFSDTGPGGRGDAGADRASPSLRPPGTPG
jgi:MFS family permease